MTLLEAQVAKVPVVASAVGGNCEVIRDGETGLLFQSGDVDGLCRHLETLFSSVAERERLATNGFKRVSDTFNLQGMIQQYLHIYHDVSDGKIK